MRNGQDRLTTAAEQMTPFRAPYAQADEDLAAHFLAEPVPDLAAEARIDAQARRLVAHIRARSAGSIGGIEDFFREYALSSKEGLALMVLAEALLRIPDRATADRLIEDKLTAGDFLHYEARSGAILISATAWALGLSARLVGAHETPHSVLENLVGRVGRPAVRTAIRQAMQLLGSHFVLGETIEQALKRAASRPDYRYSFDMLREGARTAADAEVNFEAYRHAIATVAYKAGSTPEGVARPGISVKLSALHPRFEATCGARIQAELVPRLGALAREARACQLGFVIDAEEADRLEISLDVFAAILADPALAGWSRLGLAVQAYQKRAPAMIDWLIEAARRRGAPFIVRLVKGAYWDTEIKRAQERGLSDYPVFTRKAMTDLCFVSCAKTLLAARGDLFPAFATHNALTVASVIEAAGGQFDGYEFQRLHGMGAQLYDGLVADAPDAACRIYAPVGDHRELLAYLVRRLLENGANSSFVSVAADPAVPVEKILVRPRTLLGAPGPARHPKIPLPKHLYGAHRQNAAGVEFGHAESLAALLASIRLPALEAAPLIDGLVLPGLERSLASPIDGTPLGTATDGDEAIVIAAMLAAQVGFAIWNATPVAARAAALTRAGDVIEENRGALIALLQVEGGKTLDDGVAEVREAADFCRYYAAEALRALAPETLPGPTGEANALRYRGRGVFVCISPWNFPLAIFCGQIVAALAAGNAVVAKPAEETPLIASFVTWLLHQAGIPVQALHLVPGDGRVGAMLVDDPRTAGVAFTGSTAVAQAINRRLAAKNGPIVPFIAEAGGINALIADASALPEQLTDDVIASAFRSAGQRCSALRVLCLPEEIAPALIAMIIGAARELCVGDPRAVSTDIGPVIDAAAKSRLDAWIAEMDAQGAVLFSADPPGGLAAGSYVMPTIVALDRVRDLKEEIFGPILHVVRYPSDGLDEVLDDIAAGGFGLTLGLHTRIAATIDHVVARLRHGNVYVNRNMIGAVVGTQPFGGSGRSGTGPKAGGPNYLRRFALEQVVTINTAAAGGNASLLAETEE